MDPEDIMLSEISHTRERQILYYFIYMWNLKNKTNEQTLQSRVKDTENKQVVTRRDVGGERKEIVKGH